MKINFEKQKSKDLEVIVGDVITFGSSVRLVCHGASFGYFTLDLQDGRVAKTFSSLSEIGRYYSEHSGAKVHRISELNLKEV